MKRKRIENDLIVKWSHFTKDGEKFNIQALPVALYLKNQFATEKIEDFSVVGNTLTWTFYGKDQKHCGVYSLILKINEGDKGMIALDACNFVQLVNCSCEEGGFDEGNVETETIEIESHIDVAAGGGGASILIDGELSLESNNPVANKVITAALNDKAGKDELPKKLSELENDLEFESYDDSELRELIRQDAENLEVFTERVYDIAEGLQGEIAEKATISDLQGLAGHVAENYATKDEVKPYDDSELRTAINKKVDSDKVATINGQSLVEGGNIVIPPYDDKEIKEELKAVNDALKDKVDSTFVNDAISAAITETLNTEV